MYLFWQDPELTSKMTPTLWVLNFIILILAGLTWGYFFKIAMRTISQFTKSFDDSEKNQHVALFVHERTD